MTKAGKELKVSVLLSFLNLIAVFVNMFPPFCKLVTCLTFGTQITRFYIPKNKYISKNPFSSLFSWPSNFNSFLSAPFLLFPSFLPLHPHRSYLFFFFFLANILSVDQAKFIRPIWAEISLAERTQVGLRNSFALCDKSLSKIPAIC